MSHNAPVCPHALIDPSCGLQAPLFTCSVCQHGGNPSTRLRIARPHDVLHTRHRIPLSPRRPLGQLSAGAGALFARPQPRGAAEARRQPGVYAPHQHALPEGAALLRPGKVFKRTAAFQLLMPLRRSSCCTPTSAWPSCCRAARPLCGSAATTLTVQHAAAQATLFSIVTLALLPLGSAVLPSLHSQHSSSALRLKMEKWRFNQQSRMPPSPQNFD